MQKIVEYSDEKEGEKLDNGKISVIVPIYKVEQYLPKCIDSIINQTYKNLEIILVDDGSPDNCGRICDEYAEKDDRIKVIHQENMGLPGARNSGMDIASGEYIAFVDSDDWLELDMYECLLKQIIENETDAAYCGFFIENETSEISTLPGKVIETNREFCGNIMRSGWIYSVVWNKLMKRRCVAQARFDDKADGTEDSFFWYGVRKNVNSICFYPKPLYHYNKMNDNSATSSKDISKSLIYVREFFVDDVKDEELRQIAVESLVQSYTMLINWAVRRNVRDRCKEWTERFGKYEKDVLRCPNVSMRKKILVFLLFHAKPIYILLCRCSER